MEFITWSNAAKSYQCGPQVYQSSDDGIAGVVGNAVVAVAAVVVAAVTDDDDDDDDYDDDDDDG